MSRHAIPKTALEHHIAFVGKTGSGKTGSAKSGIIEPALAAGERVCVIDPTGAWWGLRLATDGKHRGFPIYVFGGDHGDYPLLANQGEMIAEAIGTTNTPAILDTTRLKTTERMRFFTDFADTILRVNQGALRLVVDEAHLFAPQAGTRGSGVMPDMLHAANNLISLGRSRGLRIVLISQRPAKVHKDSLTQVESLVAMRLIAPQDRKAVEEWIADQADRDKGKEIIASLPSLKTGEAWVWSPEASFLNRVTFPLPCTYDSSKLSTGQAKKRLSPIDLEKLQEKFAKVKTEAEANDPKALRRRIAELEAAQRKAAAATPAIDPDAIAAAEKRGYERGTDAMRKEAEKMVSTARMSFLAELGNKLAPAIDYLRDEMQRVKRERPTLTAPVLPAAPPAKPSPAPAKPRPPAPPPSGGAGPITAAMLETLGALAWWTALGKSEVTKKQLAGMLGIAPSGSTMRGRLAALANDGLIAYPRPGLVTLTAAGHEAAPAPDTEASLVETIRKSLSASELETFDAIPADPAASISRAELGMKIGGGIEPGGSTMRGRLAALSNRELISYPSSGFVSRQEWVID